MPDNHRIHSAIVIQGQPATNASTTHCADIRNSLHSLSTELSGKWKSQTYLNCHHIVTTIEEMGLSQLIGILNEGTNISSIIFKNIKYVCSKCNSAGAWWTIPTVPKFFLFKFETTATSLKYNNIVQRNYNPSHNYQKLRTNQCISRSIKFIGASLIINLMHDMINN